MQPPRNRPRIDLAELKALMVKKLGPEGSKQYFSFLSMFLSLKLTKVEFDRACVRIVGRENIPLHNQLIRSILINACCAKAPPPGGYRDDISKHGGKFGSKDVAGEGYMQNGSHIGVAHTGLENGGNMLPLSPRKARTGLRDWRTGDRRSALGPNGKTGFAPSTAATQLNEFNVMLENGDLHLPDIVPSGQRHQGLMRQPESDSDAMISQVAKRSPLQAPFGMQFTGRAQRALPPASSCRSTGTLNDVALLDTLTLKERMEQIVMTQGLEGVSVESANVLNHGLDSYIKGLIRSCIEFVGSRSENESMKNDINKSQTHTKLVNGFRPGHQHRMHNTGKPLEVPEQKTQCPISLQDFRVSMELNPQKLGEDWPLLLERICTRAIEK